MNRKITLVFFFLIIVAPGGVLSAPQSLTRCRIQPRVYKLQRTSRPLRISGTVSGRSTNEYHLQIQADFDAEIKLTTNSELKFDVYLADPPTAIQKRVTEWSGKFSMGKEYVIAVNNCSGTTRASFQLVVTPR